MTTAEAALTDLEDEFDLLGDWEERFRHVIEMGRGLEPLTDEERSDANKVRGCASQVWLVSEHTADGTLKFRGNSDAHLVRGLIAILLKLYSNRTPAEILGVDVRTLGGQRQTQPQDRQVPLPAPGQVVEADARPAQVDDAVQLGAPVVGRGGVVDFLDRAAGDLPAVDAVEAGAGQALAVDALAGAFTAL